MDEDGLCPMCGSELKTETIDDGNEVTTYCTYCSYYFVEYPNAF